MVPITVLSFTNYREFLMKIPNLCISGKKKGLFATYLPTFEEFVMIFEHVNCFQIVVFSFLYSKEYSLEIVIFASKKGSFWILWHQSEFSLGGFYDNPWSSLYALNSFRWTSHVTFCCCMYIFACTDKCGFKYTFSKNCFRKDLWLILNTPLLRTEHFPVIEACM